MKHGTMRVKYTRLAVAFLALYMLLSGYTGYKLFMNLYKTDETKRTSFGWSKSNRVINEAVPTRKKIWDFSLDDSFHQDPPDAEMDVKYNVEIWGKAAIGIYLWQHILEGDLIEKMAGVWSFGLKQIKDVQFRFRTGPGVVPEKVPKDVQNLVLVLNGREEAKVDFAKIWLDYLPNFEKLRNVAVVLLGNELCDNSWIKPYLTVNGGIVQFVFTVYDSPDVDDYNFYQWPLGVATYRNFPRVDVSSINSQKKRYFWCNFLGTVYSNSSRQSLINVLQKSTFKDKCYVKPRLKWWPMETPESQADYIHALLQSDFTLSPVGINPECYRIYEAMSYGSIPILEDQATPGRCSTTRYRLLKEYHAPVVFVKHWSELEQVFSEIKTLSPAEIIHRRQDILEWYVYFRQKMKEKFTGIIRERFFGS